MSFVKYGSVCSGCKNILTLELSTVKGLLRNQFSNTSKHLSNNCVDSLTNSVEKLKKTIQFLETQLNYTDVFLTDRRVCKFCGTSDRLQPKPIVAIFPGWGTLASEIHTWAAKCPSCETVCISSAALVCHFATQHRKGLSSSSFQAYDFDEALATFDANATTMSKRIHQQCFNNQPKNAWKRKYATAFINPNHVNLSQNTLLGPDIEPQPSTSGLKTLPVESNIQPSTSKTVFEPRPNHLNEEVRVDTPFILDAYCGPDLPEFT